MRKPAGFAIFVSLLGMALPAAAIADPFVPCSQYKQTNSNGGACGDCFITFALKDPAHKARAEYVVTSSNGWTAAVIAQSSDGGWMGGGYWGAAAGAFARQAFILGISNDAAGLHLEMNMANKTLGKVNADFRCFQ